MLKKVILSTILTFSLIQTTQARVIELDNLNPNHCRQQLVKGLDPEPIVFIYMDGCHWSDKLRPNYEEVSEIYPQRSFFAFKFRASENEWANASIMRTAMECLGTTPFMSPVVAIYNVLATPNPEKYYGYINGITKLGLDGGSTKEDIIDFIGESAKAKKTQNYTLLKHTGIQPK